MWMVLFALGFAGVLAFAIILIITDARRNGPDSALSELRSSTPTGEPSSLDSYHQNGEAGTFFRQALVVDPSERMRGIIRSILMDADCGVLEAADASEGLTRLAEVAATSGQVLVVIASNLPGMNAIDFVRTVRSDVAYQMVRILLIASESERELILAIQDSGADAYLIKPLTREAILDRLEVLQRP